MPTEHTHAPGVIDPFCPACKIIIDCHGAVMAAVHSVAAFGAASIALKDQLLRMIDNKQLSPDQIDYASAWSQLQCNRAMEFVKWADQWRDETLAIGRELAGVYAPTGDYTVDGVNGIVDAGKLPT